MHGAGRLRDDRAMMCESERTRGLPLIPLIPPNPGESRTNIEVWRATRNGSRPARSLAPSGPAAQSRLSLTLSQTYSFPSIAGRELRSLGSAPHGARRGRAVRAAAQPGPRCWGLLVCCRVRDPICRAHDPAGVRDFMPARPRTMVRCMAWGGRGKIATCSVREGMSAGLDEAGWAGGGRPSGCCLRVRDAVCRNDDRCRLRRGIPLVPVVPVVPVISPNPGESRTNIGAWRGTRDGSRPARSLTPSGQGMTCGERGAATAARGSLPRCALARG